MSRILKRCIFNVFNFYKPQKRYESATMEDAILNTQICFVIKCHIPIRCIPPQKELNQVKMRYFRIYNSFKTETMLITLDI